MSIKKTNNISKGCYFWLIWTSFMQNNISLGATFSPWHLYLTIRLPISTSGYIPGGARLHPFTGANIRAPLGSYGWWGSGRVPRGPLQRGWAGARRGAVKLIAGNAAVVIYPKGLGLLEVAVNGPQGVRNLCIWNRKQKRKRKFGASKKEKLKVSWFGPALFRTFFLFFDKFIAYDHELKNKTSEKQFKDKISKEGIKSGYKYFDNF